MAGISALKSFYLSYLSKPAADRRIYRAIRQGRPRKILELGIGIGQRAVRMIEVAGLAAPPREIEFIGLDPFEARSSADGPGVTLKMAHRLLHGTPARIHLVPGDPIAGLVRVANDLGQVDLMVLSARLDPRRLHEVWLYMPRLLHERSEVFLEKLRSGGQTSLRKLDRSEIDALTALCRGRRAA